MADHRGAQGTLLRVLVATTTLGWIRHAPLAGQVDRRCRSLATVRASDFEALSWRSRGDGCGCRRRCFRRGFGGVTCLNRRSSRGTQHGNQTCEDSGSKPVGRCADTRWGIHGVGGVYRGSPRKAGSMRALVTRFGELRDRCRAFSQTCFDRTTVRCPAHGATSGTPTAGSRAGTTGTTHLSLF